MLESYRTIKSDGMHEIEIDRSQFITYLKRTETEEEARQFIDEIKKKHHDATHNCSAYQIGDHNEIQRAHDDGEPSGTAGVPMLEIFKKRELKNVTAVVTRYFGGKKLGAGGLIRAYGGSVNQAVDAIGVVERRLLQEVRIQVSYALSGRLENELRNAKQYILQDIEYLENVTFVVYVEVNEVEEFTTWTTNLLSAQGEYKLGKQAYIEIEQEQ